MLTTVVGLGKRSGPRAWITCLAALFVVSGYGPAARADDLVLTDSLAMGGRSIAVSGNALYVLGGSDGSAGTTVTALSFELQVQGLWSTTEPAWSISGNGSTVCVATGHGVDWYSPGGSLQAHADGGHSSSLGGVALAANGHAITASDSGDFFLVELSPTGEPPTYLIQRESYPDDHLRDLAYAADGTLYVVDYFDGSARTSVDRVVSGSDYSLQGVFATEGGCIGPGANHSEIYSMGADPAGNLYAIDRCDGVVEKHDSSGNLDARWSCGEMPTDVIGDAFGNVYVLTATHVWKYGHGATPAIRRTWGQVRSFWR